MNTDMVMAFGPWFFVGASYAAGLVLMVAEVWKLRARQRRALRQAAQPLDDEQRWDT
jgi:heme exporter protein D